MIKASAPGKLYIAGEYAVLEPGHPAVLVALDQFITVCLSEADQQGTIRSSYSKGISIPWTRKNGKIYIDERENPFSYITKSVTMTEIYLQERGHQLKYFDLDIQSELDNKDGRKYGLGSSGAVTIATIKALLSFYHESYDSELLYKLAVMTHLSLNSNGSFGDLAASSFEGWIAYACFDREWLIEKRKTTALSKLIAIPWPKLMIKPLEAPANLHLTIGWTGTPASTTSLVDQIKDEQHEMNGHYRNFLSNSKTCVESLIAAFEIGDIKAIQACIRENRKLLQFLSDKSGVAIETESLHTLCSIAETFGGAAKSSGAGGGDCGIVIFNHHDDVSAMISMWTEKQIINLPLNVYRHPRVQQNSVIWEGK